MTIDLQFLVPKLDVAKKKPPSSRGRHNDYPDAWTDLRFDSRGHGQSENSFIIMLLYFDYCCFGWITVISRAGRLLPRGCYVCRSIRWKGPKKKSSNSGIFGVGGGHAGGGSNVAWWGSVWAISWMKYGRVAGVVFDWKSWLSRCKSMWGQVEWLQ